MKATSKLISVVLILAMCVGLFTVSAFADQQVVIGGQTQTQSGGSNPNVYVGSYDGGSDEADVPATSAEAGADADETSGFAVVNGESEKVYDSFSEALSAAEAGATVKFYQDLTMSAVLVLEKDVTLDLNHKTLKFENSGEVKAAAILVRNAKVVLQSGNLLVSGEAAESEENGAKGFQSVAATEEGSLVIAGVYVNFTAPDDWNIFEDGVTLRSGSYNRDVSAYVDEEYEQVDPESEDGRYRLVEKDEGEDADGEEPAAGEEPSSDEEPAAGEEPAIGEEPAASEDPAESEEPEEGALPLSDEEQATDDPADLPVDETPVAVEEEKPAEEPTEVRGEMELPEFVSEDGMVIVKGDLPEGTVVKAEIVEVEAPDGEQVLLALNITLFDAEGNEFEPETAVIVTIISDAVKASLDEGLDLNIYHIPDGEEDAQPVKVDGIADGEVSFVTDSFSVYMLTTSGASAEAAYGDPMTGESGELHKEKVKIVLPTEIAVKGEEFTFTVEGPPPMAVSIIDPDDVSSSNEAIYKAGLLDYEEGEYTMSTADGVTTITITGEVLERLTTGKHAIALWYQDTVNGNSTRVYVVSYIIVVPKLEIKPLGPTDKDGNLLAEKCDLESLQFLVTSDEITGFKIVGENVNIEIEYDPATEKVTITNTETGKTKKLSASSCFGLSDYVTTDALGHSYVAGKVLTLYPSLLKELKFNDPYGEYTITITADGVDDAPEITMHLTPGIRVADGLDDYIKGKNAWVKFEACAPIDYDPDGTLAIWIGGQKISHEYYSISNDHQTLWIYRNLLDQLRSNNSYTLTARLWKYLKDPDTGKQYKATWYPATASFNVLAAGSTSYKSPKTGDSANIGLWAAVLVVSGGAVVALIPKKKKSSKAAQ